MAGVIGPGLILFATATFCPAENAPDNVPRAARTDNATPVASPAPAASDNTAATRDAVSREIASFENDIRDAYHRELLNCTGIEGEITVSFIVRPEGEVDDLAVAQTTLNWPPLQEEILNRIRAWKFTPFKGQPVPATVPYKFGPR